MVVDPGVRETVEQTEVVPPVHGSDEIMSLMREALRETTPTSEPASETEPPATGEAPPEPVAGEAEPPKAEPRPSRRARTVEKVTTKANQKLSEAEARATAAEERARAAEEKIAATERAEAERAEAERTAANTAAQELADKELTAWLGTNEEYAEAQRWSRMDNLDPNWDFTRHQQEVAKLNDFDGRRRYAARVLETGKVAGRTEANRALAQDFLVTLADELPEDRRDAYRTHEGGIPGAVRFWAETMWGPKVEALEAKLAEKDAELERLRAGGARSGRSPLAGGGQGGGQRLDYARSTPEQLMADELRSQANRR